MTITVEDMIKKLQEYPENYKVFISYQGGDGCETCGYGGAVESDIEAYQFTDLETKVVIDLTF